MGEFESGPFAAPVNRMLVESFGQSLDGIEVVRDEADRNAELGANAHTIGRRISLGGNVCEDPSDPFSMEVIAHEVAHALAGGGSGEREVSDRRDDPGETAAHAASDAMHAFVAGGAVGTAPRLAPATGGRARIHRHEAGEHAYAVDHAAELTGGAVDPEVAKLISSRIHLHNGLEVGAGDVTAMMGDFYGVFDKDERGHEHFDAAKSFDALDRADPEEMRGILAAIARERAGVGAALDKPGDAKFEPTSNGTLEELTAGRKRTGYDHAQTKTFLGLAQANSAHFSKADGAAGDNNMGAYGQLHALALAAARDGDDNRARALEASSQHFLTDRFASGHQFDKDRVMAIGAEDAAQRQVELAALAPGLAPAAPLVATDGANQAIGLGLARIEHQRLNKDGADVKNAAGDTWRAYGDSHWADPANALDRLHEARATVASYADLDAALAPSRGECKPPVDGSRVAREVPEFSPTLEAEVEADARHQGTNGVLFHEAPELGELVDGERVDLKVEARNARDTLHDARLRAVGHFAD